MQETNTEANSKLVQALGVPRSEYPRPQFIRDSWQTLNGQWDFEFDDNNAGFAERWFVDGHQLSKKITVPYTFQSVLSGIGTNEFHDVVWYKRSFQVDPIEECKRFILHFGAIDYLAHVWVNGILVTTHEGGHTSFSVDITDWVTVDENILTVRAEDPTKRLDQPRGKQYWESESASIFYTRTTGIWQPVWLESVAKTYIVNVKFTPDIDTHEITLGVEVGNFASHPKDLILDVVVTFGKTVAHDRIYVTNSFLQRRIALDIVGMDDRQVLWSPEHPNLFDVTLTLFDSEENVVDQVDSYFGMRKIAIESGRVFLNNHPYYMKLVLDQGYFPDGILTPPTDDAIRRDVQLTKELGFNGVRKHQKVEDPRYLYWCDKLGLLVWGEMANSFAYSPASIRRITHEWQKVIERDFNHPCIVVWVPVNESWGVPNLISSDEQRSHTVSLYHLTKSLDPTRLVVSNDGWEHTISDLVTIHDYESRKEVLANRYVSIQSALKSMPAGKFVFAPGFEYQGQPILVTEFGGISFKKSDWDGWGYSGAESDDDFIERYAAVVEAMLESTSLQGFCYTQLTDVEQEINGILTYDRQPKVPIEVIRRINEGAYKR